MRPAENAPGGIRMVSALRLEGTAPLRFATREAEFPKRAFPSGGRDRVKSPYSAAILKCRMEKLR